MKYTPVPFFLRSMTAEVALPLADDDGRSVCTRLFLLYMMRGQSKRQEEDPNKKFHRYYPQHKLSLPDPNCV